MVFTIQPCLLAHMQCRTEAWGSRHILCCFAASVLCSAGTSIEREGSPAQSVFQLEALPAMQAQPALWPPSVQGYAAFERMAGLVQSRTFHMLRQNWVTGAASEGRCLG